MKGFAPKAPFCVSLPRFVLGKQQLDFCSTVSQHAGPGQQAWPIRSFQASLGPKAQIYTDVNQVISTSRFGKEVWPKGNLTAEFKGGGGREQTLSPT